MVDNMVDDGGYEAQAPPPARLWPRNTSSRERDPEDDDSDTDSEGDFVSARRLGNANTSVGGPRVREGLTDAARLEGSDAPDWLRDD